MSRIRTRMASPGCVPSIATGPVAPFTRSICRWSSVSSSDRICPPHESWQTNSTVSPDRTVATGSRCGPKTYVMPSSNDICLIDRPTVPWNRVELCYGSSQRSFEDVPSIEGGRRGPDASGRGQGNHGRGAAAQHSPASARSGRDSSSLRGPGAGDGAFEPPWGCRGPLLRPRLRRIRCGESEGPDLAGRSVWPHVESAGDAFPRQGPPAVRPSVDGVPCGRVLRPPGVQSHDRSRSARARLSGGGFADLAACGPPAIEDSNPSDYGEGPQRRRVAPPREWTLAEGRRSRNRNGADHGNPGRGLGFLEGRHRQPRGGPIRIRTIRRGGTPPTRGGRTGVAPRCYSPGGDRKGPEVTIVAKGRT